MKSIQIFILLTTFLTPIFAETTSRPPARILKQINRQNEDGSYSYGYENDDGSYKIETKSASGEIVGKYGYIDVDGKLREIEYGASKRGFEPIGPGIKVPPPTVHSSGGIRQHENLNNVEADYDDGQYREDPSIYYKSETAAAANELNAGYNTKFETLSKQVLPAAATAAAAAAVPQQLAVPQHQRQVYQHPLPAEYKYEATLRSDPSAYRWYRPGQNYLTYNYNPSAAYQGHINPFAPQYDVFGGSYTVNYAG